MSTFDRRPFFILGYVIYGAIQIVLLLLATTSVSSVSGGALNSIQSKRIRGYFYNEMRYINLRFTYLLTYLLLNRYLTCCRVDVASC